MEISSAGPGSYGNSAVHIASGHDRHRMFRKLKLHRQFAVVLVTISLLSTVGLTSLAYVAARAFAISDAQTSLVTNVQVLRQVLATYGSSVHVDSGRLVVGTGPKAQTLNND